MALNKVQYQPGLQPVERHDLAVQQTAAADRNTMDQKLVPLAEASTDTVPPAQRLKYWESHNTSELIGLRCSSFASSGLRARERNFDLCSLRLADIVGNEHVIERTVPLLRRHPKDSIFACALLRGEAFFYQAGRCVPVREGDLIIYTTTLPYLYGFTRDMRQVQVDIDAGRLLGDGPLKRPSTPIKIDGGVRTGRRLSDMLQQTITDFMEQPVAENAPAVAGRIQTLLQALMGLGGNASQRNESAAVRLFRAEAFVAEHLCDPHLDADDVARHLAVSVRHLDRIFEVHGCTVTQWIWRQRLAQAKARLADPTLRALTVTEIALQCGFCTPSHFASTFKAQNGITPTDYRSESLKVNFESCPVLSTPARGPIGAPRAIPRSMVAADETPDGLRCLTPAERSVVRLVAEGLSYKEIARKLERSFSTVDHQLRSIRAKLGAASTARLNVLLGRMMNA
jgi:AraC-like DNA-binding protein/DNA-binding CsgD family transcriptional regulator